MKSKKQPISNAKRDNKTAIMVNVELNARFRKICDDKAFQPSKVIQRLLESWIEREKKKEVNHMVVNG